MNDIYNPRYGRTLIKFSSECDELPDIPYHPTDRVCVGCQTMFTPRTDNHMYCDLECFNKAKRSIAKDKALYDQMLDIAGEGDGN